MSGMKDKKEGMPLVHRITLGIMALVIFWMIVALLIATLVELG